MSEKDNGGAAFPVVHPDGMGVQFYGLSRLDYFAASAMNGILASGRVNLDKLNRHELSALAFGFAEAMLTRSEK